MAKKKYGLLLSPVCAHPLSLPTLLQKDSGFQESWSGLYKSASPSDRGTWGETESPPPLFQEGNGTSFTRSPPELPPQALACLVSSVLRSVKLFIALAKLPRRRQCHTTSKTDCILLAISVGPWPWCRYYFTACNQQSFCSLYQLWYASPMGQKGDDSSSRRKRWRRTRCVWKSRKAEVDFNGRWLRD